MKKIKEVSVFTNGDSCKLSTWSNVPYFFTQALTAKGIKVNRIDLSPDPSLEKRWNKFMGRVMRRIFKGTSYCYFRSFTHFKNIRSRLKKALDSYPEADANIFLTFSFSSTGLTQKPTILFCDWTYEHYFNYHANRKPDFLEKQCIKRENTQVEVADLVLPLFPSIAEHMQKHYRNKNIKYLGNVINSVYDVSETDIIKEKENSWDLIFVGRSAYKEGALALINALQNLKDDYPQLKLHIIGMNKDDFAIPSKDIYCYGYLDKGKDEDRKTYYDLFRRAKIFINTTPKWGAFSATIEAMYFYTPVIVAPYNEFVKTFGDDIQFGAYCDQNLPDEIEKNIRSILNNSSYSSFCLNAHNSVREYTWSSYIDKVIKEIELIDND